MSEHKELGIATLMQAREDMVEVFIMEYKAEELQRKADALRHDVETFLKGDLYKVIADGVTGDPIDYKQILISARKDADFRIWRSKHGCNRCKIRSCPFFNQSAWDYFEKAESRACKKWSKK